MVQNRIREFRKEKGYSQDDLSKFTGIPQTTLSYWENGIIDSTIARLIRLENTLGIKIADLLPSPVEISPKESKAS